MKPKKVKYVRSVVSYLDILGFRELIETRTAGEISRILRILAESVMPDPVFRSEKIQFTKFSDTVIRSIPTGESRPNNFLFELRSILNAQIALILEGIAFVGIGENGHLAFNDPPADFQTEEPYLIVHLDEPCRQQQVGEGRFQSLSDVPQRAISMSMRQILKAKEIICVVPDARKARAIQACFDGEISPLAPASILRTHPNSTVYLDQNSAGLLSPGTLSAFAASV